MRIALATTAALLALIAVATPVSAAGAQAMVQKQAFGQAHQAHALVEKAGWRRRWHHRHRWHHRRRGWGYGYYYHPYGLRWHRGWVRPWHRRHHHRWHRRYW